MLEKKMWYAVQIGADDNDWGYGSDDRDKAFDMAHEACINNPDMTVRIAVIDQGEDGNADPICVGETYLQHGE